MNNSRSSENISRPLQIGTRGSPLALAQADMVAQALRAQNPSLMTQRTVVSTEGDRVQDRALRDIGGKALWTRELDRALLDGDIDIAVHSMKDVETSLHSGIMLAAMLPRADVRDRLIGADSIADLKPLALIGTSSPRRVAQLLHRRPDVQTAILRGNVDRRMEQVRDGNFAATFLAAAGLDRLGRDAGVALPLSEWLPASGQGAVGITCRLNDDHAAGLLTTIDHAPTHLAVIAERGLLEGLGGSCHTAVAAHAWFEDEALYLKAELYSPDGREMLSAAASIPAPADKPAEKEACRGLGLMVAGDLLSRASPAIRESLALPS